MSKAPSLSNMDEHKYCYYFLKGQSRNHRGLTVRNSSYLSVKRSLIVITICFLHMNFSDLPGSLQTSFLCACVWLCFKKIWLRELAAYPDLQRTPLCLKGYLTQVQFEEREKLRKGKYLGYTNSL